MILLTSTEIDEDLEVELVLEEEEEGRAAFDDEEETSESDEEDELLLLLLLRATGERPGMIPRVPGFCIFFSAGLSGVVESLTVGLDVLHPQLLLFSRWCSQMIVFLPLNT